MTTASACSPTTRSFGWSSTSWSARPATPGRPRCWRSPGSCGPIPPRSRRPSAQPRPRSAFLQNVDLAPRPGRGRRDPAAAGRALRRVAVRRGRPARPLRPGPAPHGRDEERRSPARPVPIGVRRRSSRSSTSMRCATSPALPEARARQLRCQFLLRPLLPGAVQAGGGRRDGRPRSGTRPAGVAHLEKARAIAGSLEEKTGNTRYRADAVYYLGKAYYLIGDFGQARGLFQQYLAMDEPLLGHRDEVRALLRGLPR